MNEPNGRQHESGKTVGGRPVSGLTDEFEVEPEGLSDPAADSGGSSARFGAWSGVFTPSILTILGVVMYLRFGWVVGNVGLAGALTIVGLAHVISLLTGLSVSSIATNRQVGAGGAYFMISRSLGSSAGAAIGIPLFFAQALSVAFYVVGFAEAISWRFPEVDQRLIGTITCLALTLVTLKSADLAIKAQYLVMAAIGLSLVSFFLGRGTNPPTEITWWNSGGESFATVFAVFFPAVTGIMAGVGMSGDLRNPRRDLPRGTITAILVGFGVYSIFPIWLAVNAETAELQENLRIVWTIAALPTFITLGVCGATISSAIGSILTAPRTLQAIAADGLAPRFFARGAGESNEPRRGLLFTFLLAQIGVLLGNLDVIASVLTMFFLATYGVTNLACGLEKWAASPSFRPSLSIPWWVSLLGAAACFWVMSIINLAAMIVALVVCGAFFFFAERRDLGAVYGDARHGIWAAIVRSALQRLRRAEFHPVNWRPNLIILGGRFSKRSYLAELGSVIVQKRGIVSFFHLIEGKVAETMERRDASLRRIERQITSEHPNVFCRVEVVPELYAGFVTIAQSYGVGTFEANTVMLGWLQREERHESYLSAIRDLLALNRSVMLVRHDPNRGFGKRKTIDIWWGGLENNGAMMLLLAHLLKSHDSWRGAKVRLITIVGEKDDREQVEISLGEILQQTRLEAKPHVIVGGSRQLVEIMTAQSRTTDLTIIGLRVPPANENPAEFFRRYNGLLAVLPTTILVASCGAFEGVPLLLEATEPPQESETASEPASESGKPVSGSRSTASAASDTEAKPEQDRTGKRG